MDNFVFTMYGSDPYYKIEEPVKNQIEVDSAKKLSKVIGGMKAQGSDCRIIDIGGQDIEMPRMEYVRILEQQIKELRNKMNIMDQKVQRLVDQNNSLTSKLKNIEDENKRNPFRFRKN